MTAYGKPTEIKIASMQKQKMSYDVMRPGSGTPWEDRGASGVISAFLKTCGRSFFQFPGLVDQIRRPETTGDATAFALSCAVMWAISIAAWDGYLYHVANNDPNMIISGSQYIAETALRIVAAFAVTLAFLKLGATLFYSLLSSHSQQQIPKVMVYNVLGYAFGPSLLALVPVFGWGLAASWIFVNCVIGTKTRLYLKTREAVVNTLIATVVCLFLLAAAYAALYFLWPLVFGQHSIYYAPPPPPKTMMN